MVPSRAIPAKWLGLVVDQVELSHLEEVAKSGYTTWRSLPVEMIEFPVDDLAKVAVVSWRWDIDAVDHPSRNLYSTILYAKKAKLRHLFVDAISIDQNLDGDALLEQVRLFADLYQFIPVITAYDKPNCDLLSNMRRPWIASEITAFKHNPTSIVNLRHEPKKQPHVEYVPPTHMEAAQSSNPDKAVIGLDRHHGFTGRAALIWKTGIVTSIHQLLFGTVQMQNVFDLKYLMPLHAPILVAAEKQLQKNDYLLTAALLAQSDINSSNPRMDKVSIQQGTPDLSPLNFSFYRIESLGDRRIRFPESLRRATLRRTMLWGDDHDDDDMSDVWENENSEPTEAVQAFRRGMLQEYLYEDLVPENERFKFAKVTHTVSLGSDPFSVIGFL